MRQRRPIPTIPFITKPLQHYLHKTELAARSSKIHAHSARLHLDDFLVCGYIDELIIATSCSMIAGGFKHKKKQVKSQGIAAFSITAILAVCSKRK